MNIGNIGNVMQFKGAWDRFISNHPKFPMFLNAVRNKGVKEGTIMELKFIDPDGTELTTNVKVTAQDMELFESLRGITS